MLFEDDREFDVKRVFQIVAAVAAFALAIFIAVWIINYFNASTNLLVLTNISAFLNTYWAVLVGFVLLISLWEYAYPLFMRQLTYVKPIIDATSIMFGLWLVAVFLKGLTTIVAVEGQPALLLSLLHDLYFSQFVLLYVLFICIGYSRLFLVSRN